MVAELDPAFASIIEACAPLKVKVTLRITKGKYYLTFDGRESFVDPQHWKYFFFVGFERYVSTLVIIQGFSCKKVTAKEPALCVIYLGTLFDFLKTNKV